MEFFEHCYVFVGSEGTLGHPLIVPFEDKLEHMDGKYPQTRPDTILMGKTHFDLVSGRVR